MATQTFIKQRGLVTRPILHIRPQPAIIHDEDTLEDVMDESPNPSSAAHDWANDKEEFD